MRLSILIQNLVGRVQAARHREAVVPLEAVILAKVEGLIAQTIRQDIEISALQLHQSFQPEAKSQHFRQE
jgi:hypothetical protein